MVSLERTLQGPRNWSRLWAALAVVALIVASCSSGDSVSTATESASFDNVDMGATDAMFDDVEAAGVDQGAMAREGADTAAETAGLGSSGIAGANAGQVGVDPQALGREIIFTANLLVGVDDIAAAGAEASRIVAANGGLLFGQQTTSQGEAKSVLTFRVRPENFQTTLDALGDIGELRNQSISTEDVTGAVVDLESRIETAEASLERLRDLIGGAEDVEVLASIERQLLERETELAVMRGQLRTVRDRIDLATITMTLTSAIPRPAIEVQTSAYNGHDGGIGCPSGRSGDFERGVDATLCFEIVNAGESPVTDITIADTALDLETSDFIVVFGELSGELLPGQSVVVATEIVPERTLRQRTLVTAVPLTADGEPLAQKLVNANADRSFTIFDEGPPSVGDAFAGGWDALKNLFQLVLVAAAALIWFIWIPIAAWLIWKWLRRRSADARERQQAEERREEDRRLRINAEAHAEALARRAEAAAAGTPPPPLASETPVAGGPNGPA